MPSVREVDHPSVTWMILSCGYGMATIPSAEAVALHPLSSFTVYRPTSSADQSLASPSQRMLIVSPWRLASKVARMFP